MKKRLELLYRRFFPKRQDNYRYYQSVLEGLNGIEIGGPSSIFTSAGFLPVYDKIGGLDGCNFSTNTIWEGNIGEGNNYRYGNKTGYQYISDGTNLEQVPTGKYDFVLSCHSIEHIANPLKALTEWKRVIKDKGYILLVVPHKDNTFDHNRPVTTLEHLIDDYKQNMPETDNTHFEEVISLHDISRDAGITNIESLKTRTEDNFSNRCVHHHVFNTPLVARMADHLNMKIMDIRLFNPFHIIALLQKNENEKPDNSRFLDPGNVVYQNPNFPSDKLW